MLYDFLRAFSLPLQLSRYLNRQYWEKVKDEGNTKPSAPDVDEEDVSRRTDYKEEPEDLVSWLLLALYC